MELVRSRRPDVQIAYTFYSPSAEKFAGSFGADFVDYLPFDTFDDADAILSALRPSVLVFSKLDVWPALAVSVIGMAAGEVAAYVGGVGPSFELVAEYEVIGEQRQRR